MKATITHLRQMMPGQSEQWYERIATAIESGKMSMPSFETEPQKSDRPAPPPPPPVGVSLFKVSEQESSMSVSAGHLQSILEQRQRSKKRDTSVSWVSKSKLSKLCSSQKVTDRLLASVRAENPDKSEQWVWDKVIWDLERDRL